MLRRILATLTALACLGAIAAGLATPVAQAAPAATTATATAPPHVFWILMENQGYSTAVLQPYTQTLMSRYAYSDMLASSHPSLPNYLALTSGQTLSTCGDCSGSVPVYNVPTIFGSMEAAGVSWGAYAEDLPTAGYLQYSADGGLYQAKHFPPVYYQDVRNTPAMLAKVQPLTSLTQLLSGPASAVPDYAWITPNINNDGHNTGAAYGDHWLSTFVPQILASPAWQSGGVLVITWDEGEGVDHTPAGGHVLTLLISNSIPGGVISGSYSHYSLLRSVEQAWGLPYLGQAASAASVPQLVSALQTTRSECAGTAPTSAVFGSPGATVHIGSGTLTVTGLGGTGRVALYPYPGGCYLPAVLREDTSDPSPSFTSLRFSWCGWGDVPVDWQPHGGVAQPMPTPTYDAATGCVTSVLTATTAPPLADYVLTTP